MNKALRYFGGKKKYYVPFFVLSGIYLLKDIVDYYTIGKAFLNPYYMSIVSSGGILQNVFAFISETLFLLSIVSLWFSFKRKAFIIIISIYGLSSLLDIIMGMHNFISYDYIILSVIIGVLYKISCILAVILLWLKANNKIKIKPYMMILFIPMSDIVSFIMGIIESNNSDYMYFDMLYNLIYVTRNLIFSLLPQLCLVGAFVLLWLPLEKFSVCSKCGHRNTKNSAFCGLCGSKIK